jgi:hypothetical protein
MEDWKVKMFHDENGAAVVYAVNSKHPPMRLDTGLKQWVEVDFIPDACEEVPA